MRFTHDDRKNGFFHELRTELRNDVMWVLHERVDHKTGKKESEGRMSFGNLETMFSTAVASILNPSVQQITA